MLNFNTLFLLVVMIETQTNLICNGDLQSYDTTIVSNGSLNNTEYSYYAETNASCWIRNSLASAGAFTNSIQVKLISLPAWPVNTKGIDSVSYDRYGVCQNLTLIASSKYTLKYNLVLDASIINATFGTYVNSVLIFSKIYNKTYTVYTQIFNFTANKTSNLLCLQPDLINYNSSFSSMSSYKYGPIIDNISLYLSSQLVNSTTNSTTYPTNSTMNSTVNSTVNSKANSTTTNSTINSNNSALIISNSTTNSTSNSTTSLNNSTTLISNSTTNSTTNQTTKSTTSSNNSNYNSSNSTTNSISASNSTTDNSNSTNSSSLWQNSTVNSSINESTSNITSNFTNNTIPENSSTAQNVSLSNFSVNTSNSYLPSTNDSSTFVNNITSNYSQNLPQITSNNATLGNISINTTSINNNDSNISNIIPSNMTIPTTLPPTLPPTIPSFIQNPTDIQIIVNFKSQISSLSENIVIVSDLKPSKYGISIAAFSNLKVQIQQTIQTNLIYYADINGYLCIQFLPDSYFDQDTILDTLKIYLPSMPFDIYSYKFTVIVDGKSINVVILTDSQKYMMQQTLTTMETISKVIQKSFLVINSVSCSYFLISLLGFYNLSLMYIFIKLKTLPNFARIFLNTLAYVFFSKGSVTEFIKETFKIEHQINWFDFPLKEKMESHKEQFIWFGVFGNSSNFMLNNFESLVLLSILLIKFIILKIILIKILPEKLKLQLDVKPFKFYQHFLGQLSCFVPFFVVSSTECIVEMGESNWDGQLNNLVQILVFFLISIITIVGFCLAYLIQNRKLLRIKKFKKSIKSQKFVANVSKYQQIKRSTTQKYTYFLLCFLIPFVVIIGSNILFFILVSPIIVWRFYSSIISLHRKKSIQNIFKLMNKIVWVVYHFGFLLLFILQLLQIDATQNMVNFIKYVGFVLIFCVLIGAFIDILQVVISVIIALVEFIKICVKSCKNKVSPCSQKSDINIKKTQEASAQASKDRQNDSQIDRQKQKTQKINQAQCLKLKIEDIQSQQKEENKKIRASLSQQQKIKKMKTTRIKNASTNRHITDKRLKIKELD